MKIVINTDGGCRGNSKDGLASAAFVARTADGRYLASQSEVLRGTNNIAEYHGVRLALRALPLVLDEGPDLEGPFELEFHCDAKLIVYQMNGSYQVKDPDMARLSQECRRLLSDLGWTYEFKWIPREENKEADHLCGLAMNGQIKVDPFTALPCHNKDMKATCGQLFRLHGKLATPRPMRVDAEGFALCNGCGKRLALCTCPPLAEELTVQAPDLILPAIDSGEVDWDSVPVE